MKDDIVRINVFTKSAFLNLLGNLRFMKTLKAAIDKNFQNQGFDDSTRNNVEL